MMVFGKKKLRIGTGVGVLIPKLKLNLKHEQFSVFELIFETQTHKFEFQTM